MIRYNTSGFAIMLAFRRTGSVFPSAGALALIPATVSGVLTWFKTHHADAIPEGFFPSAEEYSLFQTFSWVLGFILVFRTSQAYTRYWEGAQLLHTVTSEWFDACAQCSAFALVSENSKEDILAFIGTLIRLFSLLHCSALQQVSVMEDDKFVIIDPQHLNSELRARLRQFEESRTQEDRRQRTEVIFMWITKYILNATKTGMITTAPPIVTRSFQELNAGMQAMSRMVTITDTPFPFPYAHMIAVLLVVSMVLTPLVVAAKASHFGWSFLFTFVAVCMQWSVNLIAAEIEQPFGDDVNDFNLRDAQDDFNESLMLLANPKNVFPMPRAVAFDSSEENSHHRLSLSKLQCSLSLESFQLDSMSDQGKGRPSMISTKAKELSEALKKRSSTHGASRWKSKRETVAATQLKVLPDEGDHLKTSLTQKIKRKIDSLRILVASGNSSESWDMDAEPQRQSRWSGRERTKNKSEAIRSGLDATASRRSDSGPASPRIQSRQESPRVPSKSSIRSSSGGGAKAVAFVDDIDDQVHEDESFKPCLDGPTEDTVISERVDGIELSDIAGDVGHASSSGQDSFDLEKQLTDADEQTRISCDAGPNVTLETGFSRKGLDDMTMPQDGVHEDRYCAALPLPDCADHVAYFQGWTRELAGVKSIR